MTWSMISSSCDHRSYHTVLRSISISGKAVADGTVLASLSSMEVPLRVWLGVGSGVGSPGLSAILGSEWLY